MWFIRRVQMWCIMDRSDRVTLVSDWDLSRFVAISICQPYKVSTMNCRRRGIYEFHYIDRRGGCVAKTTTTTTMYSIWLMGGWFMAGRTSHMFANLFVNHRQPEHNIVSSSGALYSVRARIVLTCPQSLEGWPRRSLVKLIALLPQSGWTVGQ